MFSFKTLSPTPFESFPVVLGSGDDDDDDDDGKGVNVFLCRLSCLSRKLLMSSRESRKLSRQLSAKYFKLSSSRLQRRYVVCGSGDGDDVDDEDDNNNNDDGGHKSADVVRLR
jgi:hypothetical protein